MDDLLSGINIEDPLLHTEQAATLLGLSRQTLAIWRHKGIGNLAYVKLGKRAVRYRLSDLRQFIADNRREG